MILSSLKELYLRDLKKLKTEISSYKSEEKLWVKDGEIKNSGGNLCLHLVGNLKTFIGSGFGVIEYERDRPFEFNGQGVNKEELIKSIDETIDIVEKGLSSLSDSDLDKDFPIVIWEKATNMGYTLLHLHSHLNYHLGQVNYHRRMLDA